MFQTFLIQYRQTLITYSRLTSYLLWRHKKYIRVLVLLVFCLFSSYCNFVIFVNPCHKICYIDQTSLLYRKLKVTSSSANNTVPRRTSEVEVMQNYNTPAERSYANAQSMLTPDLTPGCHDLIVNTFTVHDVTPRRYRGTAVMEGMQSRRKMHGSRCADARTQEVFCSQPLIINIVTV